MTEPTSSGRHRIKVGVCGETGTGKTVFLTCLSQTILEAFPDEYVVDFDRYNRDNDANYYADTAQAIYKTGKTDGTLPSNLHPLTLLLTPELPQDASRFPPLAVDLMDFAGGNFHALAALTVSLEDDDSDPAVREALRRVAAFIESADAFVILVSARDLESPAPNRELFTPSVNTLLALCRLRRKPVALVLSQSHSVSQGTIDNWMRSRRVELFRRHFSDRPFAERANERPFGIARALTCYREIFEGLEPARQSGDNSIWLRDAADVVATLVREAASAKFARPEEPEPIVDDGRTRIPAAAIAIRRSSKVIVAVCGAQGAGKTVFISCLFRTFATRIFADDVLATFNQEGTDAGHWQRIEEEINKGGDTIGTLPEDLHSVELTVVPQKDAEGAEDAPGELTIEMKDFAGRHFHSWADAVSSTAESGDASPDQAAGDEVRSFLNNAHAFVILISARDVDPTPGARVRDPFTPSVDLVLDHARKKGKPVALLFSQADRVPAVTDAYVRGLDRVQTFERQFTSNYDEALAGPKPYGVVKTITCYEKGPADVKRRPNVSSFWKTEPAEVVTSLVRALVGKLKKDFDKEDEDEDKKEAERREKAERRKKYLWAAVAGAIVLLLLGGFVFNAVANLRQDTKDEEAIRQAAAAVRREPIQDIPMAAVQQVLSTSAPSRLRSGSGQLGEALDDLDRAMAAAAQRLDQSPRLDASYSAEIAELTNAGQALHAWRPDTSWQQVSERLEQRRTFISRWQNSPPKEWRERWGLLARETNRFSTDPSFAAQIRAIGTQEKLDALKSWHGGIPPTSNLQAEIARVLELLELTTRVEDREYTRLARHYGAFHLGAMLLNLRENGLLIRDIIKPMASDLADTPPQQRHFTVFIERALLCEPYECRDRFLNVNAAIAQAAQAGNELGGAVLNAWGNLLPDSKEERIEMWKSVADAMSRVYAFNTQGNAWPENLTPLPRRIEETIERARKSGADPSIELTSRLSRPLYCDEMLHLRRSLAGRLAGQPLPPGALDVHEACNPASAGH